jgi:hypothetical protein
MREEAHMTTASRSGEIRMDRKAVVAAMSVLVGLTGCGGSATPASGTAEPATEAASAMGAMPAGDGPIEPGTYRIPKSAWSDVDFTVTMPEGWTVQYGHIYLKPGAAGELGVAAEVVDSIYTDACAGVGALEDVGPSVDDLATALGQQPGPVVSEPMDTALGGYPAVRLDLTVPEGLDLASCRLEGAGLQVWHNPAADKYFVLLPDTVASVYIVDVDGQRQEFLTQYPVAASDGELAALQTVLDSIVIESPAN